MSAGDKDLWKFVTGNGGNWTIPFANNVYPPWSGGAVNNPATSVVVWETCPRCRRYSVRGSHPDVETCKRDIDAELKTLLARCHELLAAKTKLVAG